MDKFEITRDEYGTWYIEADPIKLFPNKHDGGAEPIVRMACYRIRNADSLGRIERLIRNIDIPDLTEKTLNTFIDYAIKTESHEAYIALLELKRKRFGFESIDDIANRFKLD